LSIETKLETDATPWPPAAALPARPSRLRLVRGALGAGAARRVLPRDTVTRRLLALADVVAAALALLVAVSLGRGEAIGIASVLALPLVVVVSKVMGLYDRDELVLRKSTLDEAPALFQLATLYALVVWLMHDLFVVGPFHAKSVLILWAGLFLFTALARTGARMVAHRIGGDERCLLVGDAEAITSLAPRIARRRPIQAAVIATIPLPMEGPFEPPFEEISRVVRTDRIDRVIVAPGTNSPSGTDAVVSMIKGVGVKVSVLPGVSDLVGTAVAFDDLEGLTLLGLRRFGLSRSSLLLKRAFDLVFSTVSLVVLAPLMGVIALAVRLDSRGPTLFHQTRVGRDDDIFTIRKFRTMTDGADAIRTELGSLNEADGLFKISDDPRITRVGRWLRHTSLDELPQLLNVIRGEMSLVGPRPLVLNEDQRIEGWRRRRLQLKPGMTGPWQILGSARIPLREMVKIDYVYVAEWSLWSDVKILLRTVPHVLGRRGQ
jgi:exopolysaccharide biosynthesis polyprenyl glycosylphosphotransferase